MTDAAVVLVADAGVDAGVDASVDAGPPELRLAVLATLSDGGVEPVAFVEHVAWIEPSRGFDIELGAPLQDYRLRLLDWTDSLVPSDDVAALADGGILYRIDLVQPLRAGRTYTLELDSQLGPVVTDTAGRAYSDERLVLKVRGEVDSDLPPGAKAAKSPKKKKKR